MAKIPIPAKGKTQKKIEGNKGTGAKQVAKVPQSPSKELATNNHDHVDRLMRGAGAGLEKIQREDLAIPRLTILQSLSPQVNKRGDDYVEGAEAGMIFNSVTGELYDGEKGVELAIVDFTKSDIEWIPREKGGGFVKNHGAGSGILEQTTRTDEGANVLKNGNQIVPTSEYFAFFIKEEEHSWSERIVVSLSKTDSAEARRLNTLATTYQVPVPGTNRFVRPAFYHRTYIFCTAPKENDRGNWFGWKIKVGRETLTLWDGEHIYDACDAFREAVSSGKVRGSDPAPQPGAGAASAADNSRPM